MIFGAKIPKISKKKKKTLFQCQFWLISKFHFEISFPVLIGNLVVFRLIPKFQKRNVWKSLLQDCFQNQPKFWKISTKICTFFFHFFDQKKNSKNIKFSINRFVLKRGSLMCKQIHPHSHRKKFSEKKQTVFRIMCQKVTKITTFSLITFWIIFLNFFFQLI